MQQFLNWLQMTGDEIPYLLVLCFGALAFILGGLLRPTLELAGNRLQLWFEQLGQSGRFRQAYLKDVIARSRYLTLLPANVVTARWDAQYKKRAAELENLYTPLELEELHRAEPFERERRFAVGGADKTNRLGTWIETLQSNWRKLRRIAPPTAGNLGEIIELTPQLVLRGDPGSGKTTLLRFLALTNARSLRNDKTESDRSNLAHLRLGWKKARFPILVNLAAFSDVTKWEPSRRLLDALYDSLPPSLHDLYPPRYFERLLQRGDCLLLFDGFDELGSKTARDRMATLIYDLWNMYGKVRGNRCVVSTRIVGYEGQLDKFGFAVSTVKELSPAAIEYLVLLRYRESALSEGIGRTPQAQSDLEQEYAQRAQRLLRQLEQNTNLKILTPNPLLLSLIVLVSLVRVKLPEERHLLYRDCVEILTERWQEERRANAGVNSVPTPELTLEHKLTLLRHLALTMQAQRQDTERLVLFTRAQTCTLFAEKLPDFLSIPDNDPRQRQQAYHTKAAQLLTNIREESGILLEKGLDEHGEPVIAFSHLTFQEYLVADAIRNLSEQSDAFGMLRDNLFNPAWRETLLLYASMQDATALARACLNDLRQNCLTRYLLAGRILLERGALAQDVREQIVRGLQYYFNLNSTDDLLKQWDSLQTYDKLMQTLPNYLAGEPLLDAPCNAVTDTPKTTGLVPALVLARFNNESQPKARATAGDFLALLGDPRFDAEHWHLPQEAGLGFVHIPEGAFVMGSDPQVDRQAYDGTDNIFGNEQPQHQVTLPEYWIARYPVTVAQYRAFVESSDYQTGDADSLRGTANHPVVYVYWRDALAYSRWLNEQMKAWARNLGSPDKLPQENGLRALVDGLQRGKLCVQLSSEAEWEKAARGGLPPLPVGVPFGDDKGQGVREGEGVRVYPWGNEPNPNFANYDETGIGATSTVGAFAGGASVYGVQDMSGNVWEWTRTIWDEKKYTYPYKGDDGRESVEDETLARVVRGGSFGDGDRLVRCAVRFRDFFYYGFGLLGFRVVVSPCR